MLSNYLKIAWRNITGNPLFSAINIVGLAIGLACCIIITLFVRYEMSYDKHWANADRIVRVTRDFYGNNLRLAPIAPVIAPLLKSDFPEIEDTTRILRAPGISVIRDEQSFREDGIVFADSNVFEFFALQFISGDPESALATPLNIVLTERAADRYFGNEDPLGQTLNIMGQADATITGVIRDLPDNTHMAMEMIGSINVLPMMSGPNELENWGSNNYYTYLRLPENYELENLSSRFPEFLVKHRDADAPNRTGLGLQRLPDIHLTSNRDSEWRANGSIAVVTTFSAVALVVLLLACINFMNLTTARSTQRAREVGVRKVVGARRGQLVAQFIGESILLTAFAMLLALAIVELALPFFASFVEKPLQISMTSADTLASLAITVLLVGVLAGSYPAFYLSKFRPADVLKGSTVGSGSAFLRKALVVFQFATSIALLIATGVVMAQMNYARNVELGYDRERNLTSRLPYFLDFEATWPAIKAELLSHPDITSVVYSSRLFGDQNLDGSGYFAEDDALSMETITVLSDIKVDDEWFDHFGIEFLAGRPFQKTELEVEQPSEENPVTRGYAILNESAARRFGWSPEEAIGQVVRDTRNREMTQFVDREVIGVIADIHVSSLHDEIKATIFAEPNPQYGRGMSMKLAAGDHRDAIAHFESVWSRLIPTDPPQWEFLDDRYEARYRSEERQAQMFGIFSAFAIFVATLGLFGLASFTTERRTKEIGIRKVMGASVRDIVWLLTSDFTKLVLLANLIAWPVAYYFMGQWLMRFAYRVPVADWLWLFLAAAVAALAVAWLTISVQATRAATARPVLALRYE